MLDYKLYELDNTGSLVGEATMSRDPGSEDGVGGLFTFDARVGHSYVLVYNKAYKLTFINNHVDFYPPAISNPANKLKTYKIRRGSDALMEFNGWQSTAVDEYQRLGVTYTKKGNGWSYTDVAVEGTNAFSQFDPTRAIQKKTLVYAAYDDDSADVLDGTKNLDGMLNELEALGKDKFLQRRELAEIKSGIKRFKNIKERPGVLALLNDPSVDSTTKQQLLHNLSTMTDAQLDQYAATLPPAIADQLTKRPPTLTEINAIKNYPVFTVTDPVTGVQEELKAERAIRYYRDGLLRDRYREYNRTTNDRSSGGSSGGGGGTGRGTSDKPFIPTAPKTYSVGGNGNWEQHADGRWSFVLNGGIRLTSKWGKLEYTYGDRSADGWYHFNSYGLMDTGWFKDEAGNWYYCNTEKDGFQGKMKTGWAYEPTDKNWYYLDPVSGMMRTGWVEIDGKWYYFAAQATEPTYSYDAKAEQWNHIDNGVKPMGSMYANTTTPDGYKVGADGAWVN